MSSRDDRANRLRALAERGLEKARVVTEQMATAKVSELAALALDFEQAARMVRHAVAAEAELERRRRRTVRLARDPVAAPRALIPEPRNRTVH